MLFTCVAEEADRVCRPVFLARLFNNHGASLLKAVERFGKNQVGKACG